MSSYLRVGEDKETVTKEETEKLEKQLSCFMGCFVTEISQINGYEIQLVKIAA